MSTGLTAPCQHSHQRRIPQTSRVFLGPSTSVLLPQAQGGTLRHPAAPSRCKIIQWQHKPGHNAIYSEQSITTDQ